MTLTKFLTTLTKTRDSFHSFDQFIDESLKSILMLCRNRAKRKTFVIKFRTIEFVFENSIDQKKICDNSKIVKSKNSIENFRFY